MQEVRGFESCHLHQVFGDSEFQEGVKKVSIKSERGEEMAEEEYLDDEEEFVDNQVYFKGQVKVLKTPEWDSFDYGDVWYDLLGVIMYGQIQEAGHEPNFVVRQGKDGPPIWLPVYVEGYEYEWRKTGKSMPI
jgi:hypothetical protein